MSKRKRPHRNRRRQHGYILVWFAAMMVVLLVFAGFAVDLGFWYLTGRNAQRTADSAALAGVVYREGDVTNNDTARDAALANATENGYTTGEDDTTVTVHFDDADGTTLPLNQLRVEVERKAPSFFTRLLGFNGVDISRDAVAEYEPPPPLGSPSNVLGNEGLLTGEPTWNALDPADRIEQSLWLDIHGTRTETVHGDQYQTDNCRRAAIPQPTGTIYFDAQTCLGTDTNQDYIGAGLGGGLPGRDGYNYVVEVANPEVGETIDIQLFDPAFTQQGSDCRDSVLADQANPRISYGSNLFTFVANIGFDMVNAPFYVKNTPYPLAKSDGVLFVHNGTGGQRSLPNLIGSLSQLAPEFEALLSGPPPPVPNNQSTKGVVHTYNLWAVLQNYGLSASDFADIDERFAPGPDAPTCTGDTSLRANLNIFPPGGGGGCSDCGLPPWAGGATEGETDVIPVPPAQEGQVDTGPPGSFADPDPNGPGSASSIPFAGADAVTAKPTSAPAAVPLRPSRNDFSGFDSLPETQFALYDANGTVSQPGDDVAADSAEFPGGSMPECVDTYGAYWTTLPTPWISNSLWWSTEHSPKAYIWNFIFNGQQDPNIGTLNLGIFGTYYFGSPALGSDYATPLVFDPSGIQDFGHGFRDTVRRWVDHCTVTITPGLIHNGKVQLILNTRTNLRDGFTTTQQCNSTTSTCGKGANRFSIRARRDGGSLGETGQHVSVYADQRMALMGNFLPDPTDPDGGQFWLSKVLENGSRDRVLRASFYDPGDIAVCADADGDGVPDSASGDDCSPAGYGNDVHGTLTILQPDGDGPGGGTPFPSCSYQVFGDTEQTASPCVIDVLDSDLNGNVLELRIPIPAASYSCDGDPATDTTACWIRSQFTWSDPPDGFVIRPEDVTTWTVELEGVPVRLVE